MKRTMCRIFWAAAILLLAAVMIIVNLPGKPVPSGTAPGEQLPDFTVNCLDGRSFSLSGQKGKTVVINIWATWCTPCVKELPYFDRLQREFPQEVAVLALHSLPVTSDVENYLAAFDYEIPFAVDEDGSVSELLGVSTVLPQTVIVGPDGIVTYNQEGSLTYEKLTELLKAARR